MYMTIRHYQVPPTKMAEVVRRVDEVWLDKLSKLHGFESYFRTGGTVDPDHVDGPLSQAACKSFGACAVAQTAIILHRDLCNDDHLGSGCFTRRSTRQSSNRPFLSRRA